MPASMKLCYVCLCCQLTCGIWGNLPSGVAKVIFNQQQLQESAADHKLKHKAATFTVASVVQLRSCVSSDHRHKLRQS